MSAFTPICVACAREMRCQKNDYLFADYGDAAVWAGDMYECENCKQQVVVGVARQPVTQRGEDRYWGYAPNSNLTLRREPNLHPDFIRVRDQMIENTRRAFEDDKLDKSS